MADVIDASLSSGALIFAFADKPMISAAAAMPRYALPRRDDCLRVISRQVYYAARYGASTICYGAGSRHISIFAEADILAARATE